MRVLVVCDDEARRALRTSALGRLEHDVAGACSLARVAVDARAANPDVLLVDGTATAQEARQAVERARRALERPVGALLLMPEGATWLRVPLPPDVRPAVVLASDGVDDASLRRGLEQLRTVAKVPSGSIAVYGVTLDRRSHEARANDLRVVLTPSEAAVFTAMLEQPSQVVRHEELARALYGRVLSDPRTRAAIRGHVASLRAKLDTIGVGAQLEGLRSIGYRFVERRGRPRPPR